jgi:CRISPR/Cas system CSM-associated protein Csm5 (group 7 of RAMP superfamily)
MEDKTLNKKHKLIIEVLTPLHVGAGHEKDWILGSDFIVDEKKVKVLNINKVASVVGVENLTNALLKKDSTFLKIKLAGNLNSCVEREFDVQYLGRNDIKTFIKNGFTNKPIVPGSSLKGALRSIVLESLFSKKQIKGAINNGRLNERDLFGQADKGDELFRFIKISDGSFQETTLCNTKVFNLSSIEDGGWKHGNYTNSDYKSEGFNTFYEVLPSNSKSIISINFAKLAFDNFSAKIERFSRDKEAFINTSIQDLFKLINHHTKSYLEKEKAFFEKYDQAENTDKILDSIEKLLGLINQAGDKYCILKMAAGSGFHSITGDWQFDDYSIDRLYSEYYDRRAGQTKQKSRGNKLVHGRYDKSAKSRKIAIHDGKFELMGFVKLSLASDKDVADHDAVLNNSMERIKSELNEKEKAKLELAKQLETQQQEEDRKKAEEEQRLAEEKARLEAERIAKTDAERKAEEDRIAKELAQQEENERLIQAKVEEEAKRQEANKELLEKGLSALTEMDSYGPGKNLIIKLKKKDGLPEDQFSFVEAFVKRFHDSSDRDWKDFKRGKRWKEIKGWIGREKAKQWYDELMK